MFRFSFFFFLLLSSNEIHVNLKFPFAVKLLLAVKAWKQPLQTNLHSISRHRQKYTNLAAEDD
jgi:hypothetical protein